jgi:hypothetical protein
MKSSFLIWTSRLRTDRCSTTPQRLALGRSVWSRQIPYVGAHLPLARHRSPLTRAPPLRRPLDPSSDRARGSACRRLLPGSTALDPPASGCSLGSADAGDAEGCAPAPPPERRARRPHMSLPESRGRPPRAGPELADMLTGGRLAWLLRSCHRRRRGPTSTCAAAGEEDRPPRRCRAGISTLLACSALCARWITYEHATSDQLLLCL